MASRTFEAAPGDELESIPAQALGDAGSVRIAFDDGFGTFSKMDTLRALLKAKLAAQKYLRENTP